MKIYRRSWEKWGYGRAGAVSSALPSRSGTDGVIASSAYATPVAIMTSVTASFVAGDVGRLIRLTGTPSNRYDGIYIIDVVNSGTSVSLRWNHNTGCPTSPARFMQDGTSIVWRIMESCTFTADVAGDFAAIMAGSYIAIEGAVNLSNTGLWRISHYVNTQTVILSKSYVYWVIDATSYSVYTSDALASFTSESGLYWSLVDREPINGPDAAMLVRQQLIDSGWSLWQNRGPVAISGSNNILLDDVLRSVGETDATNLPNGRITYLRLVTQLHNRSAIGIGAQYNFLIAPFLHWDPTGTATSPGNGVGGFRIVAGIYSAATPTPATGNTQCEFPFDTGTGATDIVSQGRAGLPFNLYRRDLVVLSDADEFFIYINNSGTANGQMVLVVSALNNTSGKVAGNLYTGVITAISTTSQFNTGTVDFATKGYAVGDNITVRGLSTTTPEYIETSAITSFDNTDTSNRKINVSPAMSRTYGNGSDGGIKAYLGEDPFPIASAHGLSSSALVVKLHNISRGAFATGRDFDLTNFGTTGVMIQAVDASELNPNRRSGKFGVIPIHVKVTTNSEFRGKFKYLNVIGNTKVTIGKKFLDAQNNNVYIVVALGVISGMCGVIGPISLQQAGVKL